MKPWKSQCWVIPPEQNGAFVAAMEQVLDVYKRPYDPDFPVVCMDESPRQLIGEIRRAIPGACGRMERYDFEYVRKGVCNVFLGCEPLQGKRYISIHQRRTKQEWALFIWQLATEYYPQAKRITLVMDNLATHTPGALYEVFPADQAKQLWDRFEFIYTPKHGSWLNVAEIELSVLARQCLNRRLEDIELVKREVEAWQTHRNNSDKKVDWQFTAADARIKLKRLYPKL